MIKFNYSKKEFSLMENSCIPSAVYQLIDNRIVTLAISKGLIELFGLEDEDKSSIYTLLDTNMYRDCHPDDIALLEDAAMRFAKSQDSYNVVYRSKIKGSYHIIHAFGKHIKKESAVVAVIWYVDEGPYQESSETEENKLINQYSNLVQLKNKDSILNYDYLTGLPTISYFFYLADTYYYYESVKNHETAVMLFLDLNGTRYFNAKYGFAEGDKLIIAFSKLLIKYFTNDACCRFGMDRFCVFTNDKKLEKRLKQFFTDCNNINNGNSLPVRVGIYSSKIESCPANLACDRAKIACDSSKKFPHSHFTYFNKTMLSEMEKRQYIISNIDRAIKEKWIKVYYQPIIRAANGLVCDEEALSRWIDPVKGFMNPADFIPVLEDTNLIYKLDLYVTEQILQKMIDQDKKGLYVVPISVNLSRSDFHTCDIVNEINNLVTKAGIPPGKLTIEITESIIGQDYDYMKAQIKRFQTLGFNVWMDDFGSGYSSLDVLHDIHFNLIKFDMKFLQEFSTDEKSKILLSGLIKTVIALGIDTICEGVETEEEAEFLKEIGCTKLQGFYYEKPIPLEKIYERYEKGIQIGFENTDETEYYELIGKTNLYDLSSITSSESQIYKNFFNILPMAIIEVDNNNLKIIRGNNTYKEVIKKYFGIQQFIENFEFEDKIEENGKLFRETLLEAKKTSVPLIIDDELKDGTKIHILIKKIAVNPVNKATALVIVILGVNI